MLARIHRMCSGGVRRGAAAVLPTQVGTGLGRAVATARPNPADATSTRLASAALPGLSWIPGCSTAARISSAAGASGVSAACCVRAASEGAAPLVSRSGYRRRCLRVSRGIDAGNGGALGSPFGPRETPTGAGHRDMAIPRDHTSRRIRVDPIADQSHCGADGVGATAASARAAGVCARRSPAVPEPGRGIHQRAVLDQHMAAECRPG